MPKLEGAKTDFEALEQTLNTALTEATTLTTAKNPQGALEKLIVARDTYDAQFVSAELKRSTSKKIAQGATGTNEINATKDRVIALRKTLNDQISAAERSIATQAPEKARDEAIKAKAEIEKLLAKALEAKRQAEQAQQLAEKKQHEAEQTPQDATDALASDDDEAPPPPPRTPYQEPLPEHDDDEPLAAPAIPEEDVRAALLKLDQIKFSDDEALKDDVAKIKAHLDSFKSHIESQLGKELHDALMLAINDTVNLLSTLKPSEEQVEAYKATANSMQGHSRPALQILGGIMLTLGFAVGAAVAIAVTGLIVLPVAIPAAAILPAGIGSAALMIAGGFSLFTGRQHGIADDMHQMAKEHESMSNKAGA